MDCKGVVPPAKHRIVLQKMISENAKVLVVVVELFINLHKEWKDVVHLLLSSLAILMDCRAVALLVGSLIVISMMKVFVRVLAVAVQVRHHIETHKLLCVVVHLLIRFLGISMDCKLAIQRELSLIVVHMMRMENAHRRQLVVPGTCHIVLLQQDLFHVVNLL